MQEKIPNPESLPANAKTSNEEEKFKEEVKQIMDDLESIDRGTRIALERLREDKREIGEEPKNQIEEKHE